MDKIKVGSITIIIGIVIGIAIYHFAWSKRIPDIQKKLNVLTEEKKELITQVSSLKTELKQEIAKNVHTTVTTTYGDNGKLKEVKSETTDLSKIDTKETSTASTTITAEGETKYKEVIKEQLINYTGSVFVLWDLDLTRKFDYIPSTVGISYSVIPPFSVIVEYAINEKRVRIGVSLAF